MKRTSAAARGAAILCGLMLLDGLVSPVTVRAQSFEAGFQDPPTSAGIRCFWWWLNGNVTREAITRDLEEMKAKDYSSLLCNKDGLPASPFSSCGC